MKKIYLLSAVVLGSFLSNKAQAQFSIHIGLNLPARHVYVPAPQPVYDPIYNDDFDNSDDYYYLPEVEAYYSIPLRCYFYMDGNRWTRAAYLPGAYRNYDWRTARRFEVRGRRPYMNHDVYRNKWGGSANRGDWNRGNNNYAGRGNDHNNGGWGRDNRGGGFNGRGRDDRNNGGGRGNWGGGQQQQPSQPDRNNGGGRGNWGGGQQPQQPSQPDRNNGSGGRGNWGGGQQQPSQPANQNGGGQDRGNGGGGRDRGNQNGGGQIAQNNGSNGRQGGFNRPGRF
jgi:hypothetical protein